MGDFYEIDFVKAGEKKSGDAVCLRYRRANSSTMIHHVVDGGYANDGQKLVDHINESYQEPDYIDHVVLTHPDGDHAAGLQTVLRSFKIGTLWMNRPWAHVSELLSRFEYDYSEDGLSQRLKRNFPHTAMLEEIAMDEGIEIRDAFQGQNIGEFKVLSPSLPFYLDLIVESDKTPEPEREATIAGRILEVAKQAVEYIASLWGVENLKGESEGTSPENESSIIQYACLANEKMLLTADAGVKALEEAFQFAQSIGIALPRIHHFQVPHHGSRRNLSPEILDKWLGPKFPSMPPPEARFFNAIISAHENDTDHPRKAVVRALMHRGANVASTENTGWVCCIATGQVPRSGAIPARLMDYPESSESD